MKIINTIILSLLAISAYSQNFTNGVYVLDNKTVEVERKVYEISPTTDQTFVYFSNELMAKINKGSDFSINSFYQEILNKQAYPTKAKFGESILNATLLKGTALFSYAGGSENSSCVVSTPMVDIELNKGLFYFEITDSKVIVACLDGSMKSHNDKKETLLKAGQAVIAKPNSVGILEDKFEVGEGKVNNDAMNRLTAESKDFNKLKQSIMFSLVNGKVYGINLD